MFAHHDGLKHREMREQPDILKCARNAFDGALRRADVVHHLALEHDLAGIGGEHAGDEIEECGLARAVRTDQRVDVTLRDFQVDLI